MTPEIIAKLRENADQALSICAKFTRIFAFGEAQSLLTKALVMNGLGGSAVVSTAMLEEAIEKAKTSKLPFVEALVSF